MERLGGRRLCKLCGAFLATLLAASPAVPARALPYDTGNLTTYNYTSKGESVPTPAAYIPVKRLCAADFGAQSAFQIADVAVEGDSVYVLDGDNGLVYILDRDFQVTGTIGAAEGDGVLRLAGPEGLFVTHGAASGEVEIYIADTRNARIVVCDAAGGFLREYAEPGVKVAGEEVQYEPSKVAVDRAGRMFVVAKNVNRGLVELNSDGRFSGFIGAPKVQVDWSTYLYRLFATEEQLKRMEAYVPTEYNNVTVDAEGFVYATIGALDSAAVKQVVNSRLKDGYVTPIKKLNSSGDDILQRQGFFAPVGELQFTGETASIIVDVSVRDNGIYSLADNRRGRIFSYDKNGNLLYILGGSGSQLGSFSTISAVAFRDDLLLVGDKNGTVTVFEPTAYGRYINEAVTQEYLGTYEQAEACWDKALDCDANLYTAYMGKGKSEYRQGNYERAMAYFRAVGETEQYSKAKGMLRLELLTRWAAPLIIGVLVLAAGLTVLTIWRRRRKRAAGNGKPDALSN